MVEGAATLVSLFKRVSPASVGWVGFICPRVNLFDDVERLKYLH